MPLPLLSHDYDHAVKGPALLLLHSSVCDRRMWDPQWRILLDAGFRVIRCDFRGHGDTPAADVPYRDADDVHALLDELDIAETAVVASSFGGKVALELAARWPERVRSLALLNTASPTHEPSATLRDFDERETALIEAGDLEGAVELNVSTWLGPEADGNTRAMVRLMQRRAFEVQLAGEDVDALPAAFDLGAITARTLAVSGAHDLPDFREIAAGLPKVVGGARHTELPWAGHLPNLERPADTARLVLDFMSA
ncbi:alpha/beta fold hydrolase [Streptomyces sp. SBT349]|uniref:alpha/beta fold hydrolase n=1 Tax=Streptomyces sp. SBT349 TaxID=1580539 RepID=UPI00066D4277|nr:alpha/beta hydrolase [Streptomyces sp. SBT349]